MDDPNHWKQVDNLLHAALQRPPAERDAFLRYACAGDEQLEQEARCLLTLEQKTEGFLERPAIEMAAKLAVREQAILAPAPALDSWQEWEGRQLSGYRLLREIGRGGMGSVYLADRADGAFRKQVAIKLLRNERRSEELLSRFRQERQILASLDHPAIARLLDGGTTEEGLPYFVMEFVDGLPIHHWCNQHSLNITQRIELFRNVCSAVQYAHQRLVVHRDLKPANILVTPDGTVKLLDFGIAKLLKEEPGTDLPDTLSRLQIMTPEYASPEQAKRDVITTLTDVYSLGVVLYELLTGHRPYDLERATGHEVARIILQEEPSRPSDIVTRTHQRTDNKDGKQRVTAESVNTGREGDVNRLRRRLRGDLDTILLTTLRKEPARRYSSVEAFSEDLLRHLESRPIRARKDSVGYRASRFAHRNPGGVIAVAVIALLTVSGVVTSMWEIRVMLDAAQQRFPASTMLASQGVLLLCSVLAMFVVSTYLTRAMPKRISGALAGGVLVATDALIKLRFDYAMGWVQNRLSGSFNLLPLLSSPILFLIVMFGGASYLLLMWRVSRRFGWAGLTVLMTFVGIHLALKERLWWDTFVHITTMPFVFHHLVADAALWIVGFGIGYFVMRLVAGGARIDSLARKPLSLNLIEKF